MKKLTVFLLTLSFSLNGQVKEFWNRYVIPDNRAKVKLVGAGLIALSHFFSVKIGNRTVHLGNLQHRHVAVLSNRSILFYLGMAVVLFDKHCTQKCEEWGLLEKEYPGAHAVERVKKGLKELVSGVKDAANELSGGR